MKKSDLAGIMVAWEIELFEYDIIYAPRNNIKSQVSEDFLIKLSSPILEEILDQWILSVDSSSNLKDSVVGIALEGLRELIL